MAATEKSTAAEPIRYFVWRHESIADWQSHAPASAAAAAVAMATGAEPAAVKPLALVLKTGRKPVDAQRTAHFLKSVAATGRSGRCIGFCSVNGSFKFNAIVRFTVPDAATAPPNGDTTAGGAVIHLEPILVFPCGFGTSYGVIEKVESLKRIAESRHAHELSAAEGEALRAVIESDYRQFMAAVTTAMKSDGKSGDTKSTAAGSSGAARDKRATKYAVKTAPPKDASAAAATEKPFFECDSTDPAVVQSALLKRVEAECGSVVLLQYVGSRRYGVNGAGSDLDFLCVYRASTEVVLSLYPPPNLYKNPEGAMHDVTVMELLVFCRMIAEGDPRMVECLYVPPSQVLVSSTEFEALRSWALAATPTSSACFLTRRVVEKYLHDIEQPTKWQRLKNFIAPQPAVVAAAATAATATAAIDPSVAPTQKLWYLVYRLLFAAADVLVDTTIRVYFADSKDDSKSDSDSHYSAERSRFIKRLRTQPIDFAPRGSDSPAANSKSVVVAASPTAAAAVDNKWLLLPPACGTATGAISHSELLRDIERRINGLHCIFDARTPPHTAVLPALLSADTERRLQRWLYDFRFKK